MSFVNKLEIQGIRSVGPNDDNALKVKFFRPFTLITGENGAGKTTIIEALKVQGGRLTGFCPLTRIRASFNNSRINQEQTNFHRT